MISNLNTRTQREGKTHNRMSDAQEQIADLHLPISGAGYWISPGNRFFLVSKNHIDAVCDHPSRFGTDESSLREIYASHHEPYRSQGLALIQIIRQLVRNGWIRARNHSNWWDLNLPFLDPIDMMRVTRFFSMLCDDQDNTDVCLDTFGERRWSSVREILRFGLFPQGYPQDFEDCRLYAIVSASEIPDSEVVRVKWTE